MHRYLAILLLALVILGLAHSTYSFFHGRFGEAMLMFPLLAGCYVFFLARDRQQESKQQQELDQDQEQDRDH
ncbi:MAG: hypothetical protein ACLFMR_09595 [Desulfohalobiaceae bacterium]